MKQGLLLVGFFLVAVEGFDSNSTVRRFKRAVSTLPLQGRGPTNFGDLLDNPRQVAEKLCNWRLNGGRLTSIESNQILDLILVQAEFLTEVFQKRKINNSINHHRRNKERGQGTWAPQ